MQLLPTYDPINLYKKITYLEKTRKKEQFLESYEVEN